ncbi:MAG: glycoside hydrolase family 19 protein [Pseudomonadota bacterium]|nr:glycoside hydrolase family 19 protein [Pseudomonadota bacterium]
MDITHNQLIAASGASNLIAQAWLSPIANACRQYAINTPLRLAAFLAQIGHESANLTQTEESFNYSPEGLIATFAKMRRMPTLAHQLGRQPGERIVPMGRQEKIANIVYGGRLGNGEAVTGDGWAYRGSGLIQTTGRENFTSLADGIKIDVLSNPDLVRNDKAVAAIAAAYYWYSNNLNMLADASKFDQITKRINPAMLGEQDRLRLYESGLKAIKG